MSSNTTGNNIRRKDLERVASSNMNLDGASDRAPGSRRGSQSGSQPGSQPGSQRGSPAGSPARPRSGSLASSPGSPTEAAITATTAGGKGGPGGYAKPMGYDPARDRPPMTETEIIAKRVDLPADAYKPTGGGEPTRFTERPGFNSIGKPITLNLNCFPVESYQDKDIYQYDVIVSPNVKESRGLVKKCWEHDRAKEVRKAAGGFWLFDGNKLAWSSVKIPRGEARVIIDLDANKPPSKLSGKKGVFNLVIRQTTTIRLAYLKTYLEGKIGWDVHVLECLNFLDHCMREWPSERLLSIRRNWYENKLGQTLSMYSNVRKGYYSAIRLGESIKTGGSGLSINVDVANTVFWSHNSVSTTAVRMLNDHKKEWQSWDHPQMSVYCKPVKSNIGGKEIFVPSEPFNVICKLARVKVTVNHRNKEGDPKQYTIKRVIFDPKYGETGATSRAVMFDKKMPDGTTKSTSIWQHFMDAYGIRLEFPNHPIVETTRGGLFPMEVLNLVEHQRYNYKLPPHQVQQMIKFAVTRPDKRKGDIMMGHQALNFRNDPYLKGFGIKISERMTDTRARLLPNPTIHFGNSPLDPKMSGRWDLRGKRFLEINKTPLERWAFFGCANSCSQGHLETFANKFSQTYTKHGGRVARAALTMIVPNSFTDYGTICEQAYNKAGAHFKAHPQIIFFVLPDKNSLVYERIKKSMDCRWNIPSQVMQGGHVIKQNEQYMSNVAMKVNAKLGGATCKVGKTSTDMPFWSVPTMMIGLDVSHAAPGSSQPSMAAMTVSLDKIATKYAAACETNDWRVEVVQPRVMHSMFPRLLHHWRKSNGCSPQHVYVIRDGVAEGQFQHVIDTEIKELKRIFREQNATVPKFTVIIATKRHHIRFFPKDRNSGDRNNNPLPGTLVERDVTHPHHFDFYLCSHVAIQGTARPVHYQVILDEASVQPNVLQMLLYQQCYQYCRSTTPVSLHPAVYYSHLASVRARCHEDIASSQKELGQGKMGFPIGKLDSEIYSGPRPLESTPLLAMRNPKQPAEQVAFMNTTMWFV
ncbi:Piwi domain-containing protein [Xylariaceae sp. FL0016]|nr:Piwi domain-containing protein [Xylariaceae sp. FL0016]